MGNLFRLEVIFLLETSEAMLLDSYAVKELSFRNIMTHSPPPRAQVRNQWLKEQNLNCSQSTLTLLSQVEKQHDRVEKHKKYS